MMCETFMFLKVYYNCLYKLMFAYAISRWHHCVAIRQYYKKMLHFTPRRRIGWNIYTGYLYIPTSWMWTFCWVTIGGGTNYAVSLQVNVKRMVTAASCFKVIHCLSTSYVPPRKKNKHSRQPFKRIAAKGGIYKRTLICVSLQWAF